MPWIGNRMSVGPMIGVAPFSDEVVAVERDVERPERRLGAEAARELRPQALGEEHPAPADADDREVARGARRLRAGSHVVREPADGALQILSFHSVLHQRSGPQSGRERSPSMSTVNTFVPVRPRNGYVTDRS